VATQALYLKWRPDQFDDLIGQEHVVRTLLGQIRLNRIRHAYLFSGPRGTGKTTTARLLAKSVNCLHEDPAQRPCNQCVHCQAINQGRFLDIIEIDAASHTGVDDVRELRDRIAFSPNEGRYKVYIIDEVHRFSGAAFDALLKTLEEPPEHAIFVLATTELHKVPDTIKSRCLIFEFRRVSLAEIVARLRTICDAEGIRIDDDVLELIARQGTGSVRDSISLLDQIVSDPTEHITFEVAQRMLGAAGSKFVWEVAQAIAEQDVAYGLDQINHAIDSGADPRQFGRQMVDHLRQLLLVKMGSPHLVNASEETKAYLKEQASAFSQSLLLKAIRAFNSAVDDMRGGWQPQLPLELAMVETTLASESAPPPSSPPSRSVSKPPPKQPPPSRGSPNDPKDIDFATLEAAWPYICERAVEAKSTLKALLQHCSPLQVIEGRILIISVSDQQYKMTLEDEKRLQILLDAAYEVLQTPVEIRFEVQEHHDAATIEQQHPLLKWAIHNLGAKVTSDDEPQNSEGD